jgi:hypothetical protein
VDEVQAEAASLRVVDVEEIDRHEGVVPQGALRQSRDEAV